MKEEKRWLSLLAGFDRETDDQAPLVHPSSESASANDRFGGYFYAVLICVLMSIMAFALRDFLDPANLIMLYLVGVVGVALKFGRKPAILASFLSVLAFDFFLVPPYHSLTVEDTQYLLTFFIMLVVSLLISTLTANLRYQVRISRYRERRSSALFEISRDLSAALTYEQVIDIGKRHLKAMFQAEVALLLPDRQGQLQAAFAQKDVPDFLSLVSLDKAQDIYDQDLAATAGFEQDSGNLQGILYFPLHAPMRTRGVLAIQPQDLRQLSFFEQQRLLLTCVAQIALALERLHYVDVAQETQVAMQSEQLRNSLLSALSHDVRTPLTAIVGLSSMLSSNPSLQEKVRQELADAIQEESLRMNSLVTNLLDMARLHSGGIRLNLNWQMLEDVVGSALRLMSRLLASRPIEINVPLNLPLLEFDAVLMERVLCNLLANVAKYTPPGSPCQIDAVCVGSEVQVSVKDAGPGIPAGMEVTIFEKFTRGETESARTGVGLGLSICRAIIEAHGGRIWAENCREGGARFVFALPMGSPPGGQEITSGIPNSAMDDSA